VFYAARLVELVVVALSQEIASQTPMSQLLQIEKGLAGLEVVFG
jgi:hypothetical protein